MEKTIIKGPEGEDIYKEDWTDEWGNVTKDGKVLAACGEWFDINPWKNEEIANAPMDQWFLMDEVWKVKNKPKNIGKYWMNKKGEVKCLRHLNAKLEEKKYIYWGSRDFYVNKSGSRKKRYMTLCDVPISILYSLMFLLNNDPKNKVVVDHINGDSFNNSYINLRWATKTENSSNINRSIRREGKSSIIYYAKFTLDNKFLEWIRRDQITRNYSDHINWSFRDSNSFRAMWDGFIWEKYTDVAKEYVEKYGLPNPEEWKSSIEFDDIMGNKNGCILINKGISSTVISVGSIEGDYYRFTIHDSFKTQTSRLVWCIQNEKTLEEISGLVVDHISSIDTFDNRISNLRLTTYSGNMWNKNTREKLWTAVSQINPEDGIVVKIHDSMSYAGFEMGSSKRGGSISRSISRPHKTFAGYIWSHVGKEKERWEAYIKYLETATQPGKMPKWWWKDKEHRRKLSIKCKTLYKYKKMANGYIYEISKSIPGELEEFFPDYYRKKSNKD